MLDWEDAQTPPQLPEGCWGQLELTDATSVYQCVWILSKYIQNHKNSAETSWKDRTIPGITTLCSLLRNLPSVLSLVFILSFISHTNSCQLIVYCTLHRSYIYKYAWYSAIFYRIDCFFLSKATWVLRFVASIVLLFYSRDCYLVITIHRTFKNHGTAHGT